MRALQGFDPRIDVAKVEVLAFVAERAGTGPGFDDEIDTLRAHIRNLRIGDTEIRVLDIDGLLKTKTDYREKDVLDKQVLLRIKRGLESG